MVSNQIRYRLLPNEIKRISTEALSKSSLDGGTIVSAAQSVVNVPKEATAAPPTAARVPPPASKVATAAPD